MPMSASQSDVRPSLADYWRGLKVQARVLNALMIRELMMRYGRGNIGFLWLIVEPMILCAGVIGLRWLIQGHQEHGVPLVALLLSGYMPLTLWRHITNRGIFLLRRNIGMLYHTNITMLDAFVMSMCLEFAGCTFAFMVNYAALLLIGVVDPIHDYGLVIGGWCLMGILALRGGGGHCGVIGKI
jgi:capsular polysaccharide transport system permease protein